MPGPTLTEALVRLHGGGRADTYGAALLDIAQDHLLWLLVDLGLLDGSSLILKGGTALRKCRLGNDCGCNKRISTHGRNELAWS